MVNFRSVLIEGEDIDLKPQSISENGWATIVPYMNARYPRRVLDEQIGAGRWQNIYMAVGNFVFCGVSIYDSELKQWITKYDTGTQDNKMETAKTVASDSFKRACSVWGIGGELYDLPAFRVELHQDEYKVDNGRAKQTYKLDLGKWTVKVVRGDDNRIVTLELYDAAGNLRNGKKKTSSATTNTQQETPAQEIEEKKEKPWLNKSDTAKWDTAVDWVKKNGQEGFKQIQKKYRLSTPVKTELESIIKNSTNI